MSKELGVLLTKQNYKIKLRRSFLRIKRSLFKLLDKIIQDGKGNRYE